MSRLNTNQKCRKRRKRRRERDRRFYARANSASDKGQPVLVTNFRRWKKMFGLFEETSVAQEAFEYFQQGGSDVSLVRVIPEGSEVGNEIKLK